MLYQYMHVCSTFNTYNTPSLYWFWYTYCRIVQKEYLDRQIVFSLDYFLGFICGSDIMGSRHRNTLCFWHTLPIYFLSHESVPIYNLFGNIRNCCLYTFLKKITPFKFFSHLTDENWSFIWALDYFFDYWWSWTKYPKEETF